MQSQASHGKEFCSACGASVGRENLKTCGACRLVRYCSKRCQKVAWPTHKNRCNDIRNKFTDDPKESSLYTELNHWKNTWNGALRYISLWAFDLANNPRDCLATHCLLIQIEPRSNPASRSKAFTMMHGQVLSRGGFLELSAKNNAPMDMVEIFKKDQRGNDLNTVQMILICESIFRIIWLGFSDEDLDRARLRKPTVSSLGADYWDDALKDAIEAGDPPEIQNCLLKAIGRHNTIVYDVPISVARP